MRDSENDPRFDTFIDHLLLTPDELLLARKAAQNVAAVLRDALQPGIDERADHLVIGGVGKRTAIRPLTAVDLVYLLRDPDIVADGLCPIEKVLRRGMPGIEPVMTERGLDLPLEDFTVSLLIGQERPGGFAFLTALGWVDSHPAAEITALRLSDSLTGGRTTRLLILLKAWAFAENAQVTSILRIPSFALEAMAREFMTDHGGEHWGDILSDFFAWVRQKDFTNIAYPGSGAPIVVDSDWIKRTESAYWRVVLAKRLAHQGDPLAELAEWRRLLGQGFGHQEPA